MQALTAAGWDWVTANTYLRRLRPTVVILRGKDVTFRQDCPLRPTPDRPDGGQIRVYRRKMAVVRTWLTRDGRWRVDLRGDGRYDLYLHGGQILRRASLERVGERLAEGGVDPADLMEQP